MALISIPTSVAGVALPGQAGKLASGPLAALFKGKGVETFNYPLDLAKDPSKSHYVQFLIKEIIPAGYETTNGTPAISGQNLQLNVANSASKINSLVSNEVNAIAAKAGQGGIAGLAGTAVNAAQGLITSLAGTSLGQAGIEAGAQLLDQITRLTPQTTQPKAYVSLYMPDTIHATYEQTYDPVGLTESLGSTVNTIRGIDQLLEKGVLSAEGGSFNLETAKKIWSSVSSDPAAIAAVSNLVGKFTSQQFSNILLQSQGYTVNPQMQMIYRGLGFRSFQLSFIFTPNSKKEAQMVDNIIYTFKYFSAPTLANAKQTSLQNMYLIPPAIFNVQFKINQIENQYLPKYADCVLKNVDVNYSPNGYAAHVDGAPVQTQLTLSFEEIEIVERGRLAQGKQGSNQTTSRGLR